MQGDGNLVLYDNRRRVFWSSETHEKGEGPKRLIMQDDNNLVIYDVNDTPIWATDSFGKGEGKAKLKLHNNGDMSLVDEAGNNLWHVEAGLQDYENEEGPNYNDREFSENRIEHG